MFIKIKQFLNKFTKKETKPNKPVKPKKKIRIKVKHKKSKIGTKYIPTEKQKLLARRGLRHHRNENRLKFDEIKNFLIKSKSKKEFDRYFSNEDLLSIMISAGYIEVERKKNGIIVYKFK